jgi:hypothetical protein
MCFFVLTLSHPSRDFSYVDILSLLLMLLFLSGTGILALSDASYMLISDNRYGTVSIDAFGGSIFEFLPENRCCL